MRERRRELVGVVTSDKMDSKVVKSHKKYKAHDQDNACRVGDTVQIRECRPISKHKKFYVSKILDHAAVV